MFKKSRLIALVILLLVVLGLLSLPAGLVDHLKVVTGGFFLPFFGIIHVADRAASKTTQTIIPRQALINQIDQLRQENQQLRIRNAQLEEVFRENDRLRRQAGFPQQTPWKVKMAQVVGRDPSNWWRTLIIDRGSRDGIRPNMAVIAPEGLVGRVSVVGYTQSQVSMVGDANCLVSVLVQETRDNGIIEPGSSASSENSMVDLTHLSRNHTLKPGQKVITSGLGGVFPKGIFVGVVVDSEAVEYGLYTQARVKLGVDVGRIEEVWVVMP
jgi:rod shape-determining protein MreC